MQLRSDPAWLNQQYDNRARIADFPQVLSRWQEASAMVRSGSDCRLDVPYAQGPDERLDVFPTAAAKAPVLVFIHGGWWRALSRRDFSFVAPVFTQAGALVVLPEYTLCPAATIEDISLQMTRALAWVWRNAAALGGDPARITVAGHSAGGHLAAMMLSCRWPQVADDLPPRLVANALSISGVFDLEPLRLAPFLAPDLRLTPQSVRRLSPAFFPRPRGTLNAVVGGDESEEFLRQNRLIRDVWGPTSVPVCENLPGHNHMTVLRNLVDPAGRLHQVALGLLGLR